jgi:thioredoxin 1
MRAVNNETFDSEVVSSGRQVLVDFWAPWCVKCSTMVPTLSAISESEVPGWEILSVDVEQNPQLATDYAVMSLPTLLVFRAGEVTNRATGLLTKAQILDLLG